MGNWARGFWQGAMFGQGLGAVIITASYVVRDFRTLINAANITPEPWSMGQADWCLLGMAWVGLAVLWAVEPREVEGEGVGL